MLEKLIFRADFFLTFFFFLEEPLSRTDLRFRKRMELGWRISRVAAIVSIETKSRMTFESFVISKDRRKEDRFRI